jgi:hypothetical protein
MFFVWFCCDYLRRLKQGIFFTVFIFIAIMTQMVVVECKEGNADVISDAARLAGEK